MSVMDVQNFEKGRIKALQDERVYIQKKTFTKWANAFLEKVSQVPAVIVYQDLVLKPKNKIYSKL
jgi:hypothetical protein